MGENNLSIYTSNDNSSWTRVVNMAYMTGGGGEVDVSGYNYIKVSLSNSKQSHDQAQLVICSVAFDAEWATVI